jgi:hypothetical protein
MLYTAEIRCRQCIRESFSNRLVRYSCTASQVIQCKCYNYQQPRNTCSCCKICRWVITKRLVDTSCTLWYSNWLQYHKYQDKCVDCKRPVFHSYQAVGEEEPVKTFTIRELHELITDRYLPGVPALFQRAVAEIEKINR